MNNLFYPFVNEPLPYAYDALEPFIDEKTMHLHHDKHLQTYIDNLNKALQNSPYLQKLSLPHLVQVAGMLPQPLQTQVRNNAGGVYNHRLYFEGLNPPREANQPHGRLAEAIVQRFSSIDKFKKLFKEAALSVFGSGYAWLVWAEGRLEIVTTPNQNAALEQGMCPILLIDVWEHAYYLKHYNVRADYVDDWQRVVDWDAAQRRYTAANPS